MEVTTMDLTQAMERFKECAVGMPAALAQREQLHPCPDDPTMPRDLDLADALKCAARVQRLQAKRLLDGPHGKLLQEGWRHLMDCLTRELGRAADIVEVDLETRRFDGHVAAMAVVLRGYLPIRALYRGGPNRWRIASGWQAGEWRGTFRPRLQSLGEALLQAELADVPEVRIGIVE